MEPLSGAASVIAVVQITGTIVKICAGYIKEVKNAKQDIISIQQEVLSLAEVFKKLSELLNSSDSTKLDPSPTLVGNIARCLSTLKTLEGKIDPGKGKKVMKSLGFRALKWPLQRNEVEMIIKELERYISLFTADLQIAQTKLTTNINQTTDNIDRKIDLEKLPIAYGAEFDSFTDQHEDECLPGTRTELRHQVAEWAVSPKGRCIFWLNGRAGTGKSTVSRTVAKTFKEGNLLGASFFFKRGEGDRGNATRFFPTITRQLVTRIPQLVPGVRKAIEDDPNISMRSLKEQFDMLLLQPLRSLESSDRQALTMVIVVDALDECEREDDIRLILKLLPQVQQLVSIRFFLTSRPELPILLGFKDITDAHQDFVLHDIPTPLIEHDISLFLKHKLSTIRKDRSLPDDWPGDNNIGALVMMSVPLFIFIATVCRIFEDRILDPEKSLTDILQYQSEESKLNGTYLPVLNRFDKYNGKTKEDLVKEFREVVGIIIILESSLSIASLSELTGISKRSITIRLESLHSVLSVPEDEARPVRLFHLSFRDFLLGSETRKKTSFWIDEKEAHRTLTIQCVSVMQRSLKRNICKLSDDAIRRKDIAIQPSDCLPPELQYACRYWVHHLVRSQDSAAMLAQVFSFLKVHFLHWVETMSLLGIISQVVEAIKQLQSAVEDRGSEISEFLHDARRFILKNGYMADSAPLQIYSSGIVFAPRNSIIKKHFNKEAPCRIKQLPKVEESWGAELQALEDHSMSVSSVAFSPDGRLLASGSDKVRLWDPSTGAQLQQLKAHSMSVSSVAFSPDVRFLASSCGNIIWLWDPSTGTQLQALDGHSDLVRCIAFSPDGRLLASGCNSTVRLWDPSTGTQLQTLDDHLDSVHCVAFSPDGKFLASGCDKMIMLWDPSTGTQLQTLEGHSYAFFYIAFSPDGRLLASCCSTMIVVWDPSTGTQLQVLEGHSHWVRCVAFSPDGQLLASGSYDNTVRLWDPSTGAQLQVLEGHSKWVNCVAFSPDGQLLASGSSDHTVKLWDPIMSSTDAQLQALDGHSGLVYCVAFSPDGQLLASGSSDKIVRLWDPRTGTQLQALDGHSKWVNCVAFSPNSQLLASNSGDNIVRLWDLKIGAQIQALDGHSRPVSSVAFSPNGRLLASGSDDNTVILWDFSTGTQLYTLEGHLASIQHVVFSPNSQFLVSGSLDNTVRLWNPSIGTQLQILKGHLMSIQLVAFSPDSQLLASFSSDRTIRLWDLNTGSELQTIAVEQWANKLSFSNNGPYLRTNLGSFDIQHWYCNSSSRSLETTIEVSVLDDQWICLRGKRILWLPPEYRPSCAIAEASDTLAIGHASGRVSFISFA